MKLARLMMSGIALVLVAAACGDDTVEPEDALTEEEAVALFESRSSVVSILSDSTNRIFESVDSAVYRCPGGDVKVVVKEFAFVPVSADTFRFVLRAESTPRGCKVTSGDLEFTLDGDPKLTESLDVMLVGLTPEGGTGSLSGGLKWTLEDRSGSCEIDLALTAEPDVSDPDNPKIKSTNKGSLCGHEVEIVTTEDIVLTG